MNETSLKAFSESKAENSSSLWFEKKFPVLDKGFVRVVDYMGDDTSIVQAARVSYGKGTKQARQDRGLIRYLLKHQHTTPFEMCEIKFHIKLPIFVARQWVRHRTANINEYSARYSVLDNEFYVPEESVIAQQSPVNAQGRGEKFMAEEANEVRHLIMECSNYCFDTYSLLLQKNLTRELARIILPTNFYTQLYWKIDLHNLLHFLWLRSDMHAQYEIREYANIMLEIVKMWVPLVYEAFCDYKKEAVCLSAQLINVLKHSLSNNIPLSEIDPKVFSLSEREWVEFTNIFMENS